MEITNNSTDEIEQVLIVQNKTKKKCIVLVFSGVLCVAVTIMVVLMYHFGLFSTTGSMNKEEAVTIMESLRNDSTNFTASNYGIFKQAFNVFDENNDGYLNKTEFMNYFELDLEYWSSFEKIDADNDNILSFPETVAYVHEMWKIKPVQDVMINTMTQLVEAKYNYKYDNTSKEDNLFMEYISILTYLVPFDAHSNGYIRHEDYLFILSELEFSNIDSDEDGKISLDDIFDLMYVKDVNMMNMYGSNYEYVMEAMNDINITSNLVESIDIASCTNVFVKKNSVLLNEGDNKRRLVYCYPILLCPFPGVCIPWQLCI